MKIKQCLILFFLFCFPVVCFSHYDNTVHNEQFHQDDNNQQVAWVNKKQFINELEQATARGWSKEKKEKKFHFGEYIFGGCASVNVNRR